MRVNRRLLTATDRCAHCLSDFQAGADDKLVASGRARGGRRKRGCSCDALGMPRIGVESTGTAHELFADAAHQLGFLVFLLNPEDTRHYAKAVGLRGHRSHALAAPGLHPPPGSTGTLRSRDHAAMCATCAAAQIHK